MTFPSRSKNESLPSLSDMKRPVARMAVRTEKNTSQGMTTSGSKAGVPFLVPEDQRKYLMPSVVPTRTKRMPGGKWFFIGIVIGGAILFGMVAWQGILMKERVLFLGKQGFAELQLAASSLKEKQYDVSVVHFSQAYQLFDEANKKFPPGSDLIIDAVRFLPGFSQVSSGKHALTAGKYFSLAGQPVAKLAESVFLSRMAYTQGEKVSLIEFLRQAGEPLKEAQGYLKQAEGELAYVAVNDLPEERRAQFLSVRTSLPTLLGLFSGFEKNEVLLEELLGGNGPRTYLFLLQNNQEMRATGGFIGSYALVNISQGIIRRFFVDGIFNPDGQLKENIVPPKPIQKISAGWSLHDSNWFPDFPTSAEKAIFFYEKTGGATVDGVITLTPTVMQRLLVVTGPIALPQYGLTVDADNFIPVVQEQVEVKFDKEFNEPKKILADLSQALFEKVFSLQDRTVSRQIAETLVAGLNEKHILLYARHPETEKIIDEVGWSGRVHDTAKDYLSVIHTNINGYKTDGVIDESIRHRAEIQEDGSVIDTVTITRSHRGGNTPYDWWNKVNADYLRVYVPKGSELLSTKGTTWEFPPAPLDYERLGFKEDADVVREEASIVVDKKSGVRVSEDAGKTVFGAWVYVSPQESVTVEYQYRLPFRVDMVALQGNEVDSYSCLFQKQSGSLGSALFSSIVLPEHVQLIWQTEPNLIPYGRELRKETDLKTDVFQGIVVGQKSEDRMNL